MRRLCLALPTNRECPGAIARLGGEAMEALARFPVEVELLVSDTAGPAARGLNARAVHELPRAPGLRVHHVDAAAQRRFLRTAAERADADDPRWLLSVLIPEAVSYGAATNRLFLAAAALGCASVHRRDSDSRYQLHDGRPVHPVVPELGFLGRTAAHARAAVDRADPPGEHEGGPVLMVGGSYVGELSIDLAPMLARDRETVYELLALWTPPGMPPDERRRFNERLFLRREHAPFARDFVQLTTSDADGAPVDMCNIAFERVHEQLPLPPAPCTIASDYFLVDVLRALALPVVQHNRAIDNFYTPERRTPQGSLDYQLRFVRFLLHMSAVHAVVETIERDRRAFFDAAHGLVPARLAAAIEDSAAAAREHNPRKLEVAQRCLVRLGGLHAAAAEVVAAQREALLADAQRQVVDFARLVRAWPALVAAARSVPLASRHDPVAA